MIFSEPADINNPYLTRFPKAQWIKPLSHLALRFWIQMGESKKEKQEVVSLHLKSLRSFWYPTIKKQSCRSDRHLRKIKPKEDHMQENSLCIVSQHASGLTSSTNQQWLAINSPSEFTPPQTDCIWSLAELGITEKCLAGDPSAAKVHLLKCRIYSCATSLRQND